MPRKQQNILRLGLALVALVALIYGVASGQAKAVWQKAVFICMECIGIG